MESGFLLMEILCMVTILVFSNVIHCQDPTLESHSSNVLSKGVLDEPDQRGAGTGVPSCVYEGRGYHPGDLFTPHKCTTCLCPLGGGPVQCSYITCQTDDKHCLKYENIPGECCPKCIQKGCHYQNTTYPAGARIATDVCRVCYCPWEGGEVYCNTHNCRPTECADPVTPEGKCCPRCLNGPNCKLGRFTLRANAVYHINKCLTCKCKTVAPHAPASARVARCWRKDKC